VIIIESKSISEYLRHLEEIGEDPAEYQGLWGYSTGVTEPRASVFEYPEYEFKTTEELSNFDLGGWERIAATGA
jgi:lysine 2,3-aminomutase